MLLTDASQVRQNDLIKIWKNVQWCPLPVADNYPDQMTGEMYAVKSVNGNVVTLNQPLLRDYRLSESVQVEVYRPIQMHIKNIRIEDTGRTTVHHGLFCNIARTVLSLIPGSIIVDLVLFVCIPVLM